jgi:hypothetical protein
MDGLQIIAQLQPVSYIFNDNMNLGKDVHYGFISEEVNSVNQALATHDANGVPYGLDSTAILAVTVNAVKELNLKLESVNNMETDNSFRGVLISWLGNVGNGIGNIFAGTFKAKDKLCINNTCVTESQLQSLLANANVGGGGGGGGDSTAPVIALVGSTPINIDINGVYADLGATATDNVDGDITSKIIVTGLPIDTSLQGIFTIHYNVADVAGNNATEVTREINVGGYVAPVVTLESISITTPATKLSYLVNDALDISGLVVTGTYSDATTKVETIAVDNVTGFDSTVIASSQTLTVTIGGKTATYTIEVK